MEQQDQLTKAELRDFLAECTRNTEFAAKNLFAEDFYAPFSSLHDRIFDIIDHSKAQKICIAGPRGLGKTTICEALLKLNILFEKSRFSGYLSHSEGNAENSTESVKMDLLTNERIRQLGFRQITEGKEGLDEDIMKRFKFSKQAWVASGHTFVLPRGAGQQIRGLKWIRYRPDFWIVDDLEDDEHVESELQRDKLKRWFFGAFLKTINRYTGDYKIIYIDTVKHEDALITHILKDPDWETERLSLYTTTEDGKYVTAAPDFMSQKDLDKEVATHRHHKIMDVFAREFGAQPTSREDNEFIGNIQYYRETDKEFQERLPYLETFVIADPSKRKKFINAQSGFAVVSVDVARRAVYIRLAMGLYMHQDEFINKLFQLCDQYGARVFGVEVTGLEEHITYPIVNAQMMTNHAHLELVELKARTGRGQFAGEEGGKVGRARSVMPLYRQGLIFHNEHATAELEAQMLGFPRPARWDVLDCIGYVPQMLDVGLRYMQPVGKSDETDEDIEAEYAQLEEQAEPKLSGWETI